MKFQPVEGSPGVYEFQPGDGRVFHIKELGWEAVEIINAVPSRKKLYAYNITDLKKAIKDDKGKNTGKMPKV